MNAVRTYFESLITELGNGWNRFWFTPVDVAGVARMRLAIGAMVCWFLAAFTGDLATWFGADGLLPVDLVRQVTESWDGRWNGRGSFLYWTEDRALLLTLHACGLMVAAAFTAGLATRITGFLTLVVVLSYVHRGPMIMGPFESVLTPMLCYLCLVPCGQRFSIDAWWQRRQAARPGIPSVGADRPLSVSARLGQRLMQVHLAALYCSAGLTKLGGEVWWDGEAMWWLMAHPESRLVDLTFLHRHEFLINFWTHGVVLFELLFGVLVWNRLARPILLALAVPHWLAIGLVTGQASYGVLMVVASMCFIPPAVTARPSVGGAAEQV